MMFTVIRLFYSTLYRYSIHSMHQYLWYEGPYMSTEFRYKFEISSKHVVKYVPQFRKLDFAFRSATILGSI